LLEDVLHDVPEYVPEYVPEDVPEEVLHNIHSEGRAMVAAVAGRRIDAPDADEVRFPLAMKDVVRRRIVDLFSERTVTALVCSAACGADLLALDAAGELHIRRRVVLPFAPDKFRETSVTDRPGEWGPLYQDVIEEVSAEGDLIVLEDAQDDSHAYAAANSIILEQAALLAEERAASSSDAAAVHGKLALAVWDGFPRGDGDMTAAFLQEARRVGFETVEVMTL
jgi:hypothetical protein